MDSCTSSWNRWTRGERTTWEATDCDIECYSGMSQIKEMRPEVWIRNLQNLSLTVSTFKLSKHWGSPLLASASVSASVWLTFLKTSVFLNISSGLWKLGVECSHSFLKRDWGKKKRKITNEFRWWNERLFLNGANNFKPKVAKNNWKGGRKKEKENVGTKVKWWLTPTRAILSLTHASWADENIIPGSWFQKVFILVLL